MKRGYIEVIKTFSLFALQATKLFKLETGKSIKFSQRAISLRRSGHKSRKNELLHLLHLSQLEPELPLIF